MKAQNDDQNVAHEQMVEEFWRHYMMQGPPPEKVRQQRIFRLLPSDTRCKFCYAPFDGYSAAIVKTMFRVHPSRFNPNYCNICDDFANKFQGGAEIPMTMMFADIRGSTQLAEKIGTKEFSELVNRFYVTSTKVLADAGAMIEKLVGDEVTSVFTPGIAGAEHQKIAIDAAQKLLAATGHASQEGPWAPVGIGIHSGEAFIGSVGTPDGMMEVAALGDVPNTAARLASVASAGEILVSKDTVDAAGINVLGLEKRHLELKGKQEAMAAIVLGP